MGLCQPLLNRYLIIHLPLCHSYTHLTAALSPLCHSSQLESATCTIAERAVSLIDLRGHAATHPRLGACDHISVHPLSGTLEAAAKCARSIGSNLAPLLPVYLYGGAHREGRGLAEIRRNLGEEPR